MKFAAIDIGSNAVRLAIARPLHLDIIQDPEFKTIEFTRLPLRLGDDVFSKNQISKKKADLLEKAMKAFALLLEIYNVDFYRACATSAMRDANNGQELVKQIKKNTGIKIDIISGKTESKLVQKAVVNKIPAKHHLLHIDVGGGSTEIAYLKNGKVKLFESFNIGTVRSREGKINPAENKRMLQWLTETLKITDNSLQAIGTGGNIVKLNQLSGVASHEFNNIKKLSATVDMLKPMNQHDRIYELKLNPDRAEVIDYAGQIFLQILNHCNIHEIIAPNVGLKDGIMMDLWQKFYRQK